LKLGIDKAVGIERFASALDYYHCNGRSRQGLAKLTREFATQEGLYGVRQYRVLRPGSLAFRRK